MKRKSQESVLREIINKDVVYEVLAQLITVKNLMRLGIKVIKEGECLKS